MKKLIVLIALILFTGLFAFNFTFKKKESLQGAWILVERKQVTEEGTFKVPFHPKSKFMKIIGENHFSTVGQFISEDYDGFFNGGYYALEDGIYTENLTYHVALSAIGVTTHYKVKFEGGRLNMTYCDKNGKVKEKGISEVWERTTVK